MAFNSYIKIDNIDGQSTDTNHTNWIDVLAFSHGASQETQFANQTNAVGRGVLSPFVFVHLLDKATPKLQQSCMSGQNIASVKLEVCAQIGGTKQKLYEVEMTNARISEAKVMTVDAPVTEATQLVGVGRDASALRLVEQVSIVAEEYKWTTHTFKSSGELGGDVAAGWNVATDQAT